MTQAAPPPPGPLPPTDSLAIWSLVLGIAGLVCCCIPPFVPSVLAIVLGGRSKEKIRASGGTLTGDTMAQVGVILGWIGLGLDLLFTIAGTMAGVVWVLGQR